MNQPDFSDLARVMDELLINQRQRMEKHEALHGPRNALMRADAEVRFDLDGHECWIIKPDLEVWNLKSLKVGYNGYVHFKERPVVEPSDKGILAYVPVHGGITYACHDAAGSVYGFDTAHHDSQKYPNRDIEWIKGQIRVLLAGILLAAQLEEAYLKADGDNERRLEIVRPLTELQSSQSPSFQAILNLFSGEL